MPGVSFQSLADGVGHTLCLAIDSSECLTLPVLPADPPWLLPYGVADGVGKDIDSLALVRCADFSRAEYSPRCAVTIFFHVADDRGESKRDVSFDVFKEALSRSNCVDMFSDVGPEMSGIFFSLAPSRCAKWLARVASSDEVNAVSKEMCWEGFKIRVNRCGIQLTRLHLVCQVRNGEGFDLHISEDPMVGASKVKSSFDATVSATKADDVEGSVS